MVIRKNTKKITYNTQPFTSLSCPFDIILKILKMEVLNRHGCSLESGCLTPDRIKTTYALFVNKTELLIVY